MLVVDLSNYDYDVDANQPGTWVPALREAGIQAAIIGSQWFSKAHWQFEQCRDGGLPVIATYAEPDVDAAIELARLAQATTVALVIEPGGIQTIDLFREGVRKVRMARLQPIVYGNRGDVLGLITAEEFGDVPLWLASYYDDRRVIRSIDWWPMLWGHQFTSTWMIAGKNRDVSEVFLNATGEEGEDAMIDPRLEALAAALTGTTDAAAQLAKLGAWNANGNSLLDGYTAEQAKLGDHLSLDAGVNPGQIPPHRHELNLAISQTGPVAGNGGRQS